MALVHRAGRTSFSPTISARSSCSTTRTGGSSRPRCSARPRRLPRLSFDPQGVYEFAFNVVPIGNDTVFAELKTLGPDRIVDLTRRRALAAEIDKPLPDGRDDAAARSGSPRHRDRLMAVVRPHVRQFGDKVHCPLSGGLDSRLVLAALRAEGCTPASLCLWRRRTAPTSASPARSPRRRASSSTGSTRKPGARSSPTNSPSRSRAISRPMTRFPIMASCSRMAPTPLRARRPPRRRRPLGLGRLRRDFPQLLLPPEPAASAPPRWPGPSTPATPQGDVTEAFDEAAFLRGIEDKILAALGLDREIARGCRAR